MTRDKEDRHEARFINRYRQHTGTVVHIDCAGYMTVREAVGRGHLQRISEGVYRPKGNQ